MSWLKKVNSPLLWVVVASVIMFGYMRLDSLSTQLEYQQAMNLQLEQDLNSVVRQYDSMLSRIGADLLEQRNITQGLYDNFRDNNRQLNELERTFNYTASGLRRDLERIAIARPTLLQRRINDATKEVGIDIESITDYTTDIRVNGVQ